VTTADLVAWIYPQGKARLWNAKRAAERFWVRIGKALVDGRWQCLWRPK